MTTKGDDVRELWGRSADDDHFRHMAHWRGSGRYADDDVWLGIGQRSVAHLADFAGRVGADLFPSPDQVVLEWGPGGGSNASAIAPQVARYHGIDVSAPTLEECARQVASVGGGDAFVGHLLEGDPAQVVDLVGEPVDVVLSTAVFQHFPGRHYGERVVAVLSELVRPGGIGLIQIRFDNGDPRYRPKEDEGDYLANFLTATSYPLDVFWRILDRHGFEPESIREVTRHNYATYLFRRR